MSAEKINTTATRERPQDNIDSLLSESYIDSSLVEMEDQLKAEGKELVLASRTASSLEPAEAQSSDLATIPSRQTTDLERVEMLHQETKMDHVQLVTLGKAGLNALARLAVPQSQSAEPLTHQTKPAENIPTTRTETNQSQPTESSSETWSGNYELARYYLLLGNLATKFVGSGGSSAISKNEVPHKRRTTRAIPASQEVRNYRKLVDSRAIEPTKSRPTVPLSSQPWAPLFNTMRQEGFSTLGNEAPKTTSPESKEVKNYGEANSLLNTLAEEKYGVASWTQLGPDEQKRIRSRALAQLHPDRGGDPALYQQVESMIMSQPLTEPLKGRPEDDIINTTFTTEPSSGGNRGSETPPGQPTYQDSFESPSAGSVTKTPLAIEAAPTPSALDPAPTFDAIEAAPTKPAIEAAPTQKAIASAPTNQE